MDAKTAAIVAHITFMGWIIAYFLNQDKQSELARFYRNQTLGLHLGLFVVFAISGVPIINMLSIILSIGLFLLWVISFINSISGKLSPVPVVGLQFQQWFNGLLK